MTASKARRKNKPKAKVKPKKGSLPKKKADATAATMAATAYESLSLEHQRFVDEYLVDYNATRAYMRCPSYAGVTYESALTNGPRLLGNARIKAAIKEREEAARKRLELTKDNVLKQLARMAFVDLKGLYREDGSLKHPHELDPDTAAAIQQIEVFEEFEGRGNERKLIGFTKKVKLADRKGTTELAMKHLGLLKDKVEHEVAPGGALAALINSISGSKSALPVVHNPDESAEP